MSQINTLSGLGGGGGGGLTEVIGAGQTVGAVTVDLITLSLGATPTTKMTEVKIAAFESTTPAGCGYNLMGAARTTGAAASLIGTPDKYVAEGAALVGADVAYVVAANTLIVRATGVAGLTINWKAVLQYMGI